MRALWVRVLEERTGANLATWNRRVRARRFPTKEALENWLESQGVHGYGRSLLLMEQFGYPDFLLASADELLAGQFSDRPGLRPIYDAVVAAASALGPLEVQARKTYVSLLTPRRTFARIRPTTRDRLDLGLRVSGAKLGGRYRKSRIHESLSVEVGLHELAELDQELLELVARSYRENS